MSDYKRLYESRNSELHKQWTYRERRVVESTMFAMHQEAYATHCAQKKLKYNPCHLVQDARAVYNGFSEANKSMHTFDEYLSTCMHNVMYKTENAMDFALWVRKRAEAFDSMEPLEIPASRASPTCSRVWVGEREVCYYALSRFTQSTFAVDPERIVFDNV
jgi:hypothetical protein